MPAEEQARAVDLEPVRGSRLPRGRALSRGELLALVATCKADPSPAGTRDAALLAVLYSGGLRRAEAVALMLEDFDTATGVLSIRSGKGGKGRTVPVRNGSRTALDAWLTVRGTEAGPLFHPTRKGGHIVRQAMSPDAVLKSLARRAEAAGIAMRFSPHDLRRTFAGDMLDAGADIATVRALMGHSSVDVTARYDRRGEQAKARAADLLHFPY
jgi:site-specific recombinase XerD